MYEAFMTVATVVLASTDPSRPSVLTWPTGFFLDRHWSSPCVEHGDLLPNVRTPCRALPRFLAAVQLEPSRLNELDATPSKDLAPSAFAAQETNYCRDCQPPASISVSGVSHPLHALTVSHAFRTCFIPDTLMGFHPSGLSFLCGAVSPFGARCPLGVLPRSFAPNRSPVFARRRVPSQPVTPYLSAQGDQAPVSAGPDGAYNASIMRLTPTIPRGTIPYKLEGASPTSLWYRTLNDCGVVFRAFISAKNSVPSAGCYTVSEAVALLGFSSSGLSRAAPGVDFSKSPSPRELLRPHSQSKLRTGSSAPQGICRRNAWAFLLRGPTGPHEVFHLVIPSRGKTVCSLLIAADGSRRPYEPPAHPLPLEPRGCVAAPLRALFRAIRHGLTCAPRDGAFR